MTALLPAAANVLIPPAGTPAGAAVAEAEELEEKPDPEVVNCSRGGSAAAASATALLLEGLV